MTILIKKRVAIFLKAHEYSNAFLTHQNEKTRGEKEAMNELKLAFRRL
jgi:hypothetical protein